MPETTGWYYKYKVVEREVHKQGYSHKYYDYEYIDSSESWRIAQSQYDYFSNPQNGHVHEKVIEIRQNDRIDEVIKNHSIEKGDLMYFLDGDGLVEHATIISSVTESDILFAGNTKRRFNYSLKKALSGDSNKVYIVHLNDYNYM